jgi:hypothetical protein
MPADLVPHEAIPALAEKVTPDMLQVLQRIHREGFILNGSEVDQPTATALRALADLGLVDRGYEERPGAKPSMWVSNGNGSRVLSYKTGIRSAPYYEIPSPELATWLEQQGGDRWWTVDGDPLLTGRVSFPCPVDELAAELRKINRPLLVLAKEEDKGAAGQTVGADKLDQIVRRLTENASVPGQPQMPRGGEDRLLYLCWRGRPYEWLLLEDSQTAEQMRVADRATTTEGARVKKE